MTAQPEHATTVCRSWEELAVLGRPVHWAMGVFDGVHRGHRLVIESAAAPDALRGVLTFDRHPLELICPAKAPRLLVPDAGLKREFLASLGVDVLLELQFTPDLASLPATDFLDRLAAACPLAGVSVGANWRFGAGREGNVELLRDEGVRRGFAVNVAPLIEVEGETVCSSAIRRHLKEGAFDRASAMLGHPFALAGVVEEGQRLARRWNFPTANLRPLFGAFPPCGAYAGRVHVEGEGAGVYAAVANFGLRPTVQQPERCASPLLEAHLFSFDGSLYGRRIVVELLHFLRPERTFGSLDALRQQIECDARDAKAICGFLTGPLGDSRRVR